MKKRIFSLVLMFAILLSGCTELTKNSVTTGSWSSKGGAFKQTSYDVPDGTILVFTSGSEVYGLASVLNENEDFNLQVFHNSDIIYAPGDTCILCADAAPEGVWVFESSLDDGSTASNLKLLSPSGEISKTVPLDANDETLKNAFSILYNEGKFYLDTNDEVIILNENGGEISRQKLPDNCRASLINGNDDNPYVVCYYDDSVEINSIDETSINSVLTLTTPNIKVFGGNNEFHFLMTNDEGLFGLQIDGSTTPIIIWKDCGINVTDLKKLISLQKEEFLYLDASGVSKLTPIDPSELEKRTELILATVGGPSSVNSTIANYNRDNNKYSVVIKDYSENGTYDISTAITRLNTDIISGKHPDLLLFSELSPFSYIKKGYLLDLNKYINDDPEIEREDIAILDKLSVGEGVYYLDNIFYIETLVGLYSEFGDAAGWTLDKYLDIERSLPPSMETLYNNTKPRFLRQISSRYLRTAVNWDTGKCDFDKDVFISILEASGRIKENPEPENPVDRVIAYGPVEVAKRTRIVAPSWVNTVWKLAYEEKMAKCKLSFVGWPTVDGSCGSDIFLNSPVGICSETKSPEGCWDFLKYLLKDVSPDNSNGLPVYTSSLKKKIEDTKLEAPKDGIKITDEDANRFFALLSEIENVALYDETILSIIDEEAAKYFATDKSAKKTAEAIQSRVQLYMDEQFS